MEGVVLLGGGGHCRACIDVLEAWGELPIAGLVGEMGGSQESVLGYSVLGTDADLGSILQRFSFALVAVGQIRDAQPRIELFRRASELGGAFPVVVSPRAYVSRHSEVEDGTIVMHGAIVNAGARVGLNCIVNSCALIEHDAQVGPHSHIATGALVNGGAIIGSGAFVGSGAIIHQGVRVGDRSVIAAGATVRRDVIEGSIVR